MKIKFYSKTNCPSCDFFGKIAEAKFPKDKFQIVKFDTDEEVLAAIEKFGMKHVPFITINDNTVIHGRDMEDLIWIIKRI